MTEETAKNQKEKQLWFKLALLIVPRIVSVYFKLVDMTSKKIFLNREYREEVPLTQRFACATFHGTMLFPVYHSRRFPAVVMISRSWDGEIIDRSLQRMGYYSARGSSSSGGKEALAELIGVIKERNCYSGMAVDAPKGPSRKVKMGIVMIAKETGQPVVPLLSWATRQIQFHSWDRMILPLPFSTIVLSWGKPTFVPPGLNNEAYEELRQEIEDKMHEAQNLAEAKVRELKGK